MKAASQNLTPITLELGGKSPVAVFDDADQENALNGITAGIFGASGAVQSMDCRRELRKEERIVDNSETQ